MANPYDEFLNSTSDVEAKYGAPDLLISPEVAPMFPERPSRSEVVAATPMIKKTGAGLFSPKEQKRDYALAKLLERQERLSQRADDPRVAMALKGVNAKIAKLNQDAEAAGDTAATISANERKRMDVSNRAWEEKQAIPSDLSRADRATIAEQIDAEAQAEIEARGLAKPADDVERALALAGGGDPNVNTVDESAEYEVAGDPLKDKREEAAGGAAPAKKRRGGPRVSRLDQINAALDESIEREKMAVEQAQNEMRARMAEEDTRMEEYLERSRTADEELKARLAEIDADEERMQFIADHPGANEGELRRAHELLNDPNVTDSRKEKIRSALEKTKEINPYRMVQSPGGMLAAVASIVAAGIGGHKNPGEQLKKAMSHDMNLQHQRQANRRELVLRTAKKRGKEMEAREALRKQEAFENQVQLYRYSNAMDMLKGQVDDASKIEGFEQAKLAADAQLEQVKYERRQRWLDRKAQQDALNAQGMQSLMERVNNPLRQMGFELTPGYSEKYGDDARRLAAVYKNLPQAFDIVERLAGFQLNPYSADAKQLKAARRQIAVAIALENQGGSGILRDAEVAAEEEAIGNVAGINAGNVVENLMRRKANLMKATENRLRTFGVVPQGTVAMGEGLVDEIDGN